jgi:hypothetical protein
MRFQRPLSFCLFSMGTPSGHMRHTPSRDGDPTGHNRTVVLSSREGKYTITITLCIALMVSHCYRYPLVQSRENLQLPSTNASPGSRIT